MRKISALFASVLFLLMTTACTKFEEQSSVKSEDISSISEEESTSSTLGTESDTLESKIFHLEVINKLSEFESPDFPATGDYEYGHVFNFKVARVDDGGYAPYLNDERLAPSKYDRDYLSYSFSMPKCKSVLKLVEEGGMHVHNEKTRFDLDEVFPWIQDVTETTLKGISIEYGWVGANPEIHVPKIKSSERQEDIMYNLTILKNTTLIKADDEMVEGGWYRNVTYILSDGTHRSIMIENGYLVGRYSSAFIRLKFFGDNPNYPDIITDDSLLN
ncbi:MAG: hypothetical protein MJ228_01060 [Bacilli bacterium]|nr:hypothetical protein [Bacilli bacterium]